MGIPGPSAAVHRRTDEQSAKSLDSSRIAFVGSEPRAGDFMSAKFPHLKFAVMQERGDGRTSS